MNNPTDKQNILYKVNDCDFIDVNDIDGIHIDETHKTMHVIYYCVPIKITRKVWQKHICERFLTKDNFLWAGRILEF